MNLTEMPLKSKTTDPWSCRRRRSVVHVALRKLSIGFAFFDCFFFSIKKRSENLGVIAVCRQRLNFKCYEWFYIRLLQSAVRWYYNYTFSFVLREKQVDCFILI